METLLAQKDLDAMKVDEIETVIAQADALSQEEMALTLKVRNNITKIDKSSNIM